jgi:hypothetical protein
MSGRLCASRYFPGSIDILISFRYVAGMFQKGYIENTRIYDCKIFSSGKKRMAKNTARCPHCGNALIIERA